MKTVAGLSVLALAQAVHAHTGAWGPGMYCFDGNKPGEVNYNNDVVVPPLYQLPKSQWWMQADRGCDKIPPANDSSLALPAGGSFTVELSNNRAFTSFSYGGTKATEWTDGGDHPQDWHSPAPDKCLNDNPDGSGGYLHTHNESTTAGTAWAISYESDISKVTMENLVVFSVRSKTPWKRVVPYDVPADLPACPEGGCYCAWLWIPDGCGQPNMYMQNFKCHVTGSTSTKKLAPAKPAAWCEGDKTKCVAGAKQMLAWNQAEGNNIVAPNGRSPGYNDKCGYPDGAQNDIFDPAGATATSTTSSSASMTTFSSVISSTTTTTTTSSISSGSATDVFSIKATAPTGASYTASTTITTTPTSTASQASQTGHKGACKGKRARKFRRHHA